MTLKYVYRKQINSFQLKKQLTEKIRNNVNNYLFFVNINVITNYKVLKLHNNKN